MGLCGIDGFVPKQESLRSAWHSLICIRIHTYTYANIIYIYIYWTVVHQPSLGQSTPSTWHARDEHPCPWQARGFVGCSQQCIAVWIHLHKHQHLQSQKKHYKYVNVHSYLRFISIWVCVHMCKSVVSYTFISTDVYTSYSYMRRHMLKQGYSKTKSISAGCHIAPLCSMH